MSNEELVKTLRDAAMAERERSARVVELLWEIDRRLLYLELGYLSLQSFCEKELGYTSGSAGRRIASMRLVREVPQALAKLRSGELSLETMQMVHTHFRETKLSDAEKFAVVEAVSGKSKREVEAIVRPQKIYTLVLTEAAFEKLRELKIRLGTSNIETILTEALNRISPAKDEIVTVADSRVATASARRALYARDGAQCTHIDENGIRCTRTENLQIDHIVPYSLGGETRLENLRLLCPEHNRLHAVKTLGLETMRPYLDK